MELKTFANALEVTNYLVSKEWRVKKSSVYQHIKDGKLKKHDDGSFYQKAVDKYAKTFLKKLGPDKPKNVDITKLHERRLQAETNKMEAQSEHWQLKTKIASGEYVRRDTFDSELALRAILFKSEIESFFRQSTVQLVALCSGDSNKIPDVIDFMIDQAENWLAEYAKPKRWIVTHKESGEVQIDSVDLPDDDDSGEEDDPSDE